MWHEVAKVSDMEDKSAQILQIEELQIALIKLNNDFYAMDNTCPHRGGPLGEGDIQEGAITCPWHGWSFDIKGGDCQTVPGIKQKCFEVKVENQKVSIDV